MPTPVPRPANRPSPAAVDQIHRWLAVVTSQTATGRVISSVHRRGHTGEELLATNAVVIPSGDPEPQVRFALDAFEAAYASAQAAGEHLYVAMRIDAVLAELRNLEDDLPLMRLVTTTTRGSVSETTLAEAYKVGLAEIESDIDENTPSVVVATDASARTGHTGAGIAAVSADGRAFVRYRLRCREVLAAELDAMVLALREFPERNITIESDTSHGVEMANVALSGTDSNFNQMMASTLSPQVKRALGRLRTLRTGRLVVVRWVHGHADHALNNAADRLAVLTRRTRGGMDSPSGTLEQVAKNILEDYIDEAVTARPVLRAA